MYMFTYMYVCIDMYTQGPNPDLAHCRQIFFASGATREAHRMYATADSICRIAATNTIL